MASQKSGGGSASLSLYEGKRGSVWYMRRRVYRKGEKPKCQTLALGSIKELPTRAHAEELMRHLQYLGSGSISEILRERHRSPKGKNLPVFSVEWFQSQLIQQGGCCAICQRVCKLIVDHDHSDQTNRGLLCTTCNSGLGMFKDDPALVRSAWLYLENSELLRQGIEPNRTHFNPRDPLQPIDLMVARDGVEPPTPAFSGLTSLNVSDRKQVGFPSGSPETIEPETHPQ